MKAILILPALLLFAITVSAQIGKLKGKVTDKASDLPIPSGIVTIEANGSTIGIDTTGIDGKYEIRSIPPGWYDIKARYPGYREVSVKGVIIKADQTAYVDIKLTLIPADENKSKKKKVKLKRVEE